MAEVVSVTRLERLRVERATLSVLNDRLTQLLVLNLRANQVTTLDDALGLIDGIVDKLDAEIATAPVSA